MPSTKKKQYVSYVDTVMKVNRRGSFVVNVKDLIASGIMDGQFRAASALHDKLKARRAKRSDTGSGHSVAKPR